jgi:hypothetical protein
MAGGDLPAVKSFLGYSVLIGLIATWIAMSELLQVCGKRKQGCVLFPGRMLIHFIP